MQFLNLKLQSKNYFYEKKFNLYHKYKQCTLSLIITVNQAAEKYYKENQLLTSDQLYMSESEQPDQSEYFMSTQQEHENQHFPNQNVSIKAGIEYSNIIPTQIEYRVYCNQLGQCEFQYKQYQLKRKLIETFSFIQSLSKHAIWILNGVVNGQYRQLQIKLYGQLCRFKIVRSCKFIKNGSKILIFIYLIKLIF
ncbi:hypothetical protein PPERSA_11184 [Pseudocohnilembus persalinus]|uniref:Uncharacterized protein n=1 Tax=Pseudocohnilembus persalinus TaxID=266149 RepID=A0A0V0QZ96_PSEPJ|nr:hypothetical protein PPERSA_11184 [Pseudocohnilembus persalinus]|eukprot:KRX07635.1 hypothetical protein PPERSA_11184 [Pseudocohnilembus persalinus]